MKKQYIFVFLALGVCFVLFQNFGYWRRPNPRPTPVNPQQPTLPPTQPPGTSAQVRVYGYEGDVNGYSQSPSRYIDTEISAINHALSYCQNNFKKGTFFDQAIYFNANVTVVNISNSRGDSIDTLCHILKRMNL